MAYVSKISGYNIKDKEARASIDEFKALINNQITEFKNSVTAQLENAASDSDAEMTAFKESFNINFDTFKTEINDSFLGFKEALTEQLNVYNKSNAVFEYDLLQQLEIFKTSVNGVMNDYKNEVAQEMWKYIKSIETYTYGFESLPPTNEFIDVSLPSINVTGSFYRVSDDVPSLYNLIRSRVSYKEDNTPVYFNVEESINTTISGCWVVSDKMIVVYELAENNALSVHPGIFLKYTDTENYTMSFGYSINNRETLDNMHRLQEVFGETIDTIVEQKTDGTETWRKWSSGVAEYWGVVSANIPIDVWSAWGSIYYVSRDMSALGGSYPEGLFVDNNIIHNLSISSLKGNCWGVVSQNTANKNVPPSLYLYSATKPTTAVSIGVGIYSKGRWK